MAVVKMPKYGMTVEKVKVQTWFVEEGDTVEPGTELVEVSENKATHTLESKVSGTVEKILVQEGDEVAPGTELVSIKEDE